jgi:hypothetical protein
MTPITPAPAIDMFRPNDEVRLIFHHGDVRSGTHGRILGCYARLDDPTYLVSFYNEVGCVEVRPNELALAE